MNGPEVVTQVANAPEVVTLVANAPETVTQEANAPEVVTPVDLRVDNTRSQQLAIRHKPMSHKSCVSCISHKT